MSNDTRRLSLNPDVARQTPKNEFGQVLKNALQQGGQLAGSLLSAVPGGGIISAAVSNVTAVTGGARAAASGIATSSSAVMGTVPSTGGVAGSGLASAGTGSNVTNNVLSGSGDVPDSLTGYLSQMRAETDRSMAMQMQMQNESREYNTLSNVLKVRHDSAKAAINNIH